MGLQGLATSNWVRLPAPRASVTNGLSSSCIETCTRLPVTERPCSSKPNRIIKVISRIRECRSSSLWRNPLASVKATPLSNSEVEDPASTATAQPANEVRERLRTSTSQFWARDLLSLVLKFETNQTKMSSELSLMTLTRRKLDLLQPRRSMPSS